MKAFHISNKKFECFDEKYAKKNGDFGKGIYLTKNPNKWNFLAEERVYENTYLYEVEIPDEYKTLTFKDKLEFMKVYPDLDFFDDFMGCTDVYIDGELQIFSKNFNLDISKITKID